MPLFSTLSRRARRVLLLAGAGYFLTALLLAALAVAA